MSADFSHQEQLPKPQLINSHKPNSNNNGGGNIGEQNLASHLAELKKRLFYVLIFFFLAFAGCYYFAADLYIFLLQPFVDVAKSRPNLATLIYTHPAEAFFTYLKLAFLTAIAVSVPVALSQLYFFLAPALYQKEKNLVLASTIPALILFTLGVLLAYFFVAPVALKFFLGFENVNLVPKIIALESQIRISDYLSLMIHLLMGFGLAFQLPLILLMLIKLQLISVVTLQKKRRYIILVIFILAGVLTPPDVLSQIMMAVPLVLLFEITILLAKNLMFFKKQ